MASPIDELPACVVEEEGTGLRRLFDFSRRADGGRGALDDDPLKILDVGHVVRPAGAIAALRWFMDRTAAMPDDPAFLARELDFWGACGDVTATAWVFARMLGQGDPPPAASGRALRREAERWCADPSRLLVPEDDVRTAFAMLRDDRPPGAATPVSKTVFARAVPLPDTALCVPHGDVDFTGPREVPKWLRDLDMRDLALCGGAALWLATGFADGPSDWDVFACGGEASWAEAERAIAALCASPHPTLVSTTGAAVTVMVFGPDVTKVQFVRRCFSSVSEALDDFDLDFCRVAFYRGELVATPRGHRALETMHTVMTPETWCSRFVHRAAKYARRGFAVRLPGLAHSRGAPLPPGDASPVDSTLRQFASYASAKVIDAQPESYESNSRAIYLAYAEDTLDMVVARLRDVPEAAVRVTTSKAPDVARMLAEVPVVCFRRWEGAEDAFFAQPRGAGRDGGFSFRTLRWGSQRLMYVHEDFVSELRECVREGHAVRWSNPRDPTAAPMEIALRFEGMTGVLVDGLSEGHVKYSFEHPALSHVASIMRACIKGARWRTQPDAPVREYIGTTSAAFAGMLRPRLSERLRAVKTKSGKRIKRTVLWRGWETFRR